MPGDMEWEYFGSENEINRRKIEIIIDNYFEEDELYLVRHRSNSLACDKAGIMNEITDLLCTANFIVWNKTFTRAIEFNAIGVLRKGRSRR